MAITREAHRRRGLRAAGLVLGVSALALLPGAAEAQQTNASTYGATGRNRPLYPTVTDSNSALYGQQQPGTTGYSQAAAGGTTADGQTPADPYGQNADADGTADPANASRSRGNPNGQPATARIGANNEPDSLPDTSDLRRTNLREPRLDETPPPRKPETMETPGIRLGTLLLRPSISQGISTESTTTGSTTSRRSYLETGLKGSLTSDWSRHQLTVNGQGRWQRNIGDGGQTKPFASLDADLRLDISRDTVAHVTAGYNFSREDTSDPNAVANASQQSDVQRLTAGLSLEHDFGAIRGTVAVEGERWQYSDVMLTDGTVVSLKDRDRVGATLRGRIGYELSPVLIPFLEASYGVVDFDRAVDANGYARSGELYGAKAGLAYDFGEKMRGELGLGYRNQRFDDARLADLDAFVAEGNLAWSPQRGTDLKLTLTTEFQPSTTAGESGYVAYGLGAALSHELRDNLVARLSGSATWNRYVANAGANGSTAYVAGTGISWGLNRYFDLAADLGYEFTDWKSSDDTKVLRAGIGVVAKR